MPVTDEYSWSADFCLNISIFDIFLFYDHIHSLQTTDCPSQSLVWAFKNIMAWPVMALLHSLAFPLPLSSSTLDAKSGGTSLSVEKTSEALKSPNGVFSAGFYSVGDNAFCFAIWFSNSRTIVWMANRDQQVNGKRSKLSILKTDLNWCW